MRVLVTTALPMGIPGSRAPLGGVQRNNDTRHLGYQFYFSLCFQVSDKKHKEKTSKVDVFSVSFGLNIEDEGAILVMTFFVKLRRSVLNF